MIHDPKPDVPVRDEPTTIYRVGDVLDVNGKLYNRTFRRTCAKRGHKVARVVELNILACGTCGTVLQVE